MPSWVQLTKQPTETKESVRTKLKQTQPALLSMSPECCICFESTTNHIVPCGHNMCKDCILRWCEKRVQCPLCKTVLVSPCPTPKLNMMYPIIALRPFPGATEFGVTLTDCTEGVMVKALAKKSLAADCGLKVGAIITHINDIPTKAHATAIQIMNAAQHDAHPLYLTLNDLNMVQQKHPLIHCLRRFRRCLKQMTN